MGTNHANPDYEVNSYRFKKDDGSYVYFRQEDHGVTHNENGDLVYRECILYRNGIKKIIDVKETWLSSINNDRLNAVKAELLKDGIVLDACQKFNMVWTPIYFNGTEI